MRKSLLILSLVGITSLACTEARAWEHHRQTRYDAPYFDLDGNAYYYPVDPYYVPGAYYKPTPYYLDLDVPVPGSPIPYDDPTLQQAARVTILLPNEDAEVWFNGSPTTQHGQERVFVTGQLEEQGTYTIKARWTENGKAVERERQVVVRPNQAQTVDFHLIPFEKLAPPKSSDAPR